MEQYAQVAMQQTLSPQMQQSLAILQAPLAELRQMINAELEENPTLEETTPETPKEETEILSIAGSAGEKQTEFYDQWSDTRIFSPETWTPEALERREHFLNSHTRTPTLQEHLLKQLNAISLSKNEPQIAAEIIGNLDEHGYLRANLNEIAFTTHSDPSQVQSVLGKIQEFDPPGVAARDLKECLFLQLKQRGLDHSCEAKIVQSHLEDLGRKKLLVIAKTLEVPLHEVQRAADVIAHLNPRPGSAFSSGASQEVTPEIIVEREGDEYNIRLNTHEIPYLRITDSYKDMLSHSSSEIRAYLRDKIKDGKFFIRSIQQRQETILSIARAIVAKQRYFLDYGPSHLKPMTMSQIANVIGLHETTVSRAVSGKYISTPQGVFEMKYFFTQGYTNERGESVSNESVRQAILALIRKENPGKPYSDQEIVRLLAQEGLAVARRTITKYREQLGILPKHLRKSF